MTAAEWTRIKHFDPSENWGDANLMSFDLVFLLDRFREFINTPIVISKGTQGTHVQTSLHYAGKAVDIVFPGLSIKDALNLFISASRFDFIEIGLYVAWEYPKGVPVAGMHLAWSQPNPNEITQKRYWIGTKAIGADGTPERIPLTKENLQAQGFTA